MILLEALISSRNQVSACARRNAASSYARGFPRSDSLAEFCIRTIVALKPNLDSAQDAINVLDGAADMSYISLFLRLLVAPYLIYITDI